jgi:hypothetical protein
MARNIDLVSLGCEGLLSSHEGRPCICGDSFLREDLLFAVFQIAVCGGSKGKNAINVNIISIIQLRDYKSIQFE